MQGEGRHGINTAMREVDVYHYHQESKIPPSVTEIKREESPIPMEEVPFHEERIESITNRDRFVARHEFGHALVAYEEGFAVELVSINPKPGVYEGVTILKGPINNLIATQKINAGGAAATDSFIGAGSDMQTIGAIQAFHGGISQGEAMSAARSIITSLSPEEWSVIEEIIAYKREITGKDIPEILARARFEVKREATIQEKQFMEVVESVNAAAGGGGGEYPITVSTTHVEDIGNGMVRKYRKLNGKIDEMSIEIFCSTCGKTNRHTGGCKNREKDGRS